MIWYNTVVALPKCLESSLEPPGLNLTLKRSVSSQ